jgi:hypothetical protein
MTLFDDNWTDLDPVGVVISGALFFGFTGTAIMAIDRFRLPGDWFFVFGGVGALLAISVRLYRLRMRAIERDQRGGSDQHP